MTLPFAPLSLPAMTRTVSPFLTFIWLQHLRRERDDPHEALVAQLPADGAEDAGPARLAVVLDDDRGVLVALDVRAVRAALLLDGAHHDGLDDVAALDPGRRDGLLHGGHDDVADPRIAAGGATEDTDAQDFPGSRVVGDPESRLLLDHCFSPDLPGDARRMVSVSLITWPSRGSRRVASAWSPTAAGSP